ncbi:MAG TPA: CmpA/NrtA family ABC transporter substrate-binding protein [Burkholderiaceae bacterium]|jgi:nitrate/nitrite transport system substrate-binding protein
MTDFADSPLDVRLEISRLRLGFVALTDCAPLIVAEVRKLGRQYGLEIELQRQPSWAAVRDKLLTGELDAAHCLYGLVYGVQLGLGGPQADMAILMTLNRNGQAISLSNRLADALQNGASLQDAFAGLKRKPVLAQTFPTGTHAMWLNYWLAAQGVHPLRDVESVVIPPPQMAEAMVQGELDGFCAGEPWHTVTMAKQAGRMVVSSAAIWPEHPEKALACRREFAALYPNTARALICTMLDACKWLETTENRRTAADWMAQPQYLNLLPAMILPSLGLAKEASSGLGLGPGNGMSTAAASRFYGTQGFNAPRAADGLWFISQYYRWGMLKEQDNWQEMAELVSQSVLFAQSASALQLDFDRPAYSVCRLIDGVEWTGKDPLGYAQGFAIRA